MTPDGVIVTSGDTRVCDEMFALANRADVRAGVYEGRVNVADDVDSVVLEGSE